MDEHDLVKALKDIVCAHCEINGSKYCIKTNECLFECLRGQLVRLDNLNDLVRKAHGFTSQTRQKAHDL